MSKITKKVLVGALAITLLATPVVNAFAADSPTSGISSSEYTEVTTMQGATGSNANAVPSVTVDPIKGATVAYYAITDGVTDFEIDAEVEINGAKVAVTTIGSGAFKNAAKVETVSVPNTIRTIEAEAFSGATSLKTVTINCGGSDQVVTFKANAFSGATALTTLKLTCTKASAITVESGAFTGLNTAEMTIELPKGMTDAEFDAMVAKLRAAGFMGKIERNL